MNEWAVGDQTDCALLGCGYCRRVQQCICSGWWRWQALACQVGEADEARLRSPAWFWVSPWSLGATEGCECGSRGEGSVTVGSRKFTWPSKESLTLCDPMDCSPPASSVHAISQARILEWVPISYSRGSFWPKDQSHVSCISCISRQILHHCTT